MKSLTLKASGMMAILLLSAGGAMAQSDINGQRCAELAQNANNDFQRRLQQMAPPVAPAQHVDQNTQALEILKQSAGGGSFFGLDIGGIMTGVANRYLNNSGYGAFTSGINSVLSGWQTTGVNALGTPGFATPSFAPQAVAPQPQQGFFSRLLNLGSSPAPAPSSVNPYQR